MSSSCREQIKFSYFFNQILLTVKSQYNPIPNISSAN